MATFKIEIPGISEQRVYEDFDAAFGYQSRIESITQEQFFIKKIMEFIADKIKQSESVVAINQAKVDADRKVDQEVPIVVHKDK